MAIPKQVEQQMKEIEEMERTLTVKPEEEAPPEPVAEAQPEGTPTEMVEQPKPTEEVKPAEDWEQKYKTLQGHFDREVPKLHHQNKELANQLHVLQEQITALQKPTQPEVDDRLVTDADTEAFGSDLMDVARRIAKEEARAIAKSYKAELTQRDAKIEKLESMLGKNSGDISTLTFEQRLDKEIPGFNELNSDPKWISWLDEIDPYTQEPRRAFAEFVYSQGDVPKLKKIVNFYQQSSQPQQVDQERQRREAELQRQVTPKRSANTASSPSQGERIYTEVEANRLWNKVRDLYTAGKNDEALSIENELSNAYSTGRIR